MSFEFLIDDWKKVPQTIKYIFGFGVFLIFITWLVDHWGGNTTYKLFDWDFRNFFFNTGVVVIILAFVPLIWTQWVYWSRAQHYRLKYPLKNLNTTFYLVWFNGKLHLFDIAEKMYYHVYPWETAQDLFFVDTGTWVNYNLENAPGEIQLEQGNSISFRAYTNGGVINTRTR